MALSHSSSLRAGFTRKPGRSTRFERLILGYRIILISINFLMVFYWWQPRFTGVNIPLEAMLALIGYILIAWCGPYFLNTFRINLMLSLIDILFVSLSIHYLPGNLIGLATINLIGIVITGTCYGEFVSSVVLAILSCLGFTLAFLGSPPYASGNQWFFILNLSLTSLLIIFVSLQMNRDLQRAEREKDESKKQLHNLEGLSRIAKEIAGELELEKLLPLIILKANQLTHTKIGGIVLQDNDEIYRIKAINGLPSSCMEQEITPGVGFLGKTLLEKRLILDQTPDFSGSLAIEHCRQAMAAPILSKDELMGLIFLLGDTADDFFSINNRLILQTLGEQAAIAVVNARRYKMTTSLCLNDYLTGLGNIRFFYRELEHTLAVASRYRQSCSLMVVDSDSLKQINDCYGNSQGFRHIKQLAEVLKNTIRSSDLIARYDRDMFMIILPQTGLTEAVQLGIRIQYQVSQSPLVVEDQTLNTSVCIGVATYPEDADNVQSLVSLVENLLHQAKQGGKNRLISTLPSPANINNNCNLSTLQI